MLTRATSASHPILCSHSCTFGGALSGAMRPNLKRNPLFAHVRRALGQSSLHDFSAGTASISNGSQWTLLRHTIVPRNISVSPEEQLSPNSSKVPKPWTQRLSTFELAFRVSLATRTCTPSRDSLSPEFASPRALSCESR